MTEQELREKIIHILTDRLNDATSLENKIDQILSYQREEIEKVEVPGKPAKGFIWRAGFEGAKREILALLK